MTHGELQIAGGKDLSGDIGSAAIGLCPAGRDRSLCDATTIASTGNGCDLACFAEKNGDVELQQIAQNNGLAVTATTSLHCVLKASNEITDDATGNIKRILGKYGARPMILTPSMLSDGPKEDIKSLPRTPERQNAVPPIQEIKNLPSINGDYTFDTFVGYSDQDKLLIEMAKLNMRMPAGSTVGIFGEKTSGKSHLLTAMYTDFVANNPGKKSILLNGSVFKELYTGACGYGGRDDFRAVGYGEFMKYFKEKIDAIFIDDLDDLASGSSDKFLDIIKNKRKDQLIVFVGSDKVAREAHGLADARLRLELPESHNGRRDRLLKIIDLRLNNLPAMVRYEYDGLSEKVLKQLRPKLTEDSTINPNSFVNMLEMCIRRNINIDEGAEQLVLFGKNLAPSDLDDPFSEKISSEKPVDIKKIIDLAIRCNVIPTHGSPKKPATKKAPRRKSESNDKRRGGMERIDSLIVDFKENL